MSAKRRADARGVGDVATAACPTCKKDVATDGAAFPFCSRRCRLVDLGNWLDGRYAIPGSPLDGGAEDEPLVMSDVEPPEDGKLPRA